MELSELGLTEEQVNGVNSILQSEGDKIRTKYNKQIKELEGKIPKEKTEEELNYEKEKADFEREKSQFNLQKQLSDKGLDSQLAKYLNVQGVEDLETYINEIADAIGKQTQTFKPSSHANNGGVTKEQFNSMNYSERMNLYNTNKSLYDILSK
jgi:predicted metal-dependent hydrolase